MIGYLRYLSDNIPDNLPEACLEPSILASLNISCCKGAELLSSASAAASPPEPLAPCHGYDGFDAMARIASARV